MKNTIFPILPLFFLPVLLGCLVVFMVNAPCASAQDISPRMRMEQSKSLGQEALSRREYALALSHLQDGLTLARQEQDVEQESFFSFRLGLAFQQQAADQKSVQSLTQAVSHYERYIVLNPRSSGAMNNLAQIYRETNRNRDAQSLYMRAIALDDSLKGFYALNLANMLTAEGKADEAARYYRITLTEHPDHPVAKQGLTDAYLNHNVSGLVSMLWQQIEKRRELDATLTALDALTRLSSSDSPDSQSRASDKVELLTCVVAGMSRGHVGPDFFSREETLKSGSGNAQQASRMLVNLADDPSIGPGVQEIIKVFAGPDLASTDNWWARRGNTDADPEEGWWPRDAFRMLLRSLGDWHKARDNEDTAIAYYKLSNELTASSDRETDLVALIRLSEIYAGQNNLPAIDDLLQQYSPTLFQGKSLAYKNSELKKIYNFHRTLGIMYGLTERWGSSSNVQSAIFQLESALKTQEIINREATRTEKLQPVSVEPRIINLLARAYTTTGDPEYGAQLQLRYAGELYEARDAASARQIMVEIDKTVLDRRGQRRYRRLEEDIKSRSLNSPSGYRVRN